MLARDVQRKIFELLTLKTSRFGPPIVGSEAKFIQEEME